MSWQVSPILAPLIAEVRAEHPGMTIYTVGDLAHQAEPSDHNPDPWGFVCAADFMLGAHFTAADAERLFDRLTALLDDRMVYVIYNRRIVSTVVSPGKVRAYTEEDPHTNHVHVSVKHGPTPHPTGSWHIYQEATVATDANIVSASAAGNTVLKSAATGGVLSYAGNGLPTGLPAGSNFLNYFTRLCEMVEQQQTDIAALQATANEIKAGQQQGTDPADIAAAVWSAPERTLTA